jgi:hypothetical protein
MDQECQGVDIDDPHFYEAFDREHGSSASRVGKADTLLVTDASPLENWPAGLILGGVAAFVAALILRAIHSNLPVLPEERRQDG